MQIRSEIDIEASAERVWELLTELGDYPRWNPFIVQARGQARLGERLELTLAPPGSPPSGKRVLVTASSEGRALGWRGAIGHPWLFCGRNAFTLVPLSEGRTRLIQEESFSGLLVPLYAAWLRRQLSAGFEAMLRALKARAERQLEP